MWKNEGNGMKKEWKLNKKQNKNENSEAQERTEEANKE